RGYVMEEGKAENIIKDPLNPYTKLLISSIPPVRGEIRPISIKEDASSLPISESCPFFSRCEYAFDRCKELPQLIGVKDRKVRCRLYESNGA
ncbi:ABC transporter ATP-binding protein, partial [Sulfolobus sp. B5]